MFFDHLRTSIADIELNLSNNRALQELRNHPVDFTEWKKITERLTKKKELADKAKKAQGHSQTQSQAEGSISSRVRNKKSDTQSVTFEKDGGNNSDKEGSDDELDSDNSTIRKQNAESLLRKLKLKEAEFFDEWSMNMAHMKLFPFDDKTHRISARMNTRLITVGGLIWNTDSKNYGRDWSGTATAATLEALFIVTYRPTLLNTKKCEGACILRRAIFDTLAKFSTQVSKATDDNRFTLESEWAFPDGMEIKVEDDNDDGGQQPIDVDVADTIDVDGDGPEPIHVDDDDDMEGVTEDGVVGSTKRSSAPQPSSAAASKTQQKSKLKSYDAKAIGQALRSVHAATAPKPKPKKIPIPSFAEVVEYLERLPLVACSHPRARPGTIETLVHNLITPIFEVGRARLLSLETFSYRFTPRSVLFCSDYGQECRPHRT